MVAAGVSGGGQRLNRNEVWMLWVDPGTTAARIWAPTNCNYDQSGNAVDAKLATAVAASSAKATALHRTP
ncbi:unnamed protein product [Citrullus colocynthis]|uniref:Uncharacterized protein n=1 Tax=Citrullus colocynthis TaxID=252529 RepID=A0ABP0XVN4_9ROSI